MKKIILLILSLTLIMTSCYVSPIMDYELTTVDNGQYAGDKTYHIVTISGPDGFKDFYFNSGTAIVLNPTSDSNKYSPGEYQGIDSCTYNGILIKEGNTIKAVGYRKENGSTYATFVAEKTIPVSKWDISIVDNGPYSEDATRHIVTITDSSWNGSIYYNFGRYDNPTSGSTWYRAKKYTGSDGKEYSGILVSGGSIIKAVSYKEINDTTYSSNIAEKDLNQWSISIVDNGPSFDDNNKRIVSIVDSVYSSCDIYYTLDGSKPTSSSTKYVPAKYIGTDSKTYFGILLPEATTVKTIAERTENGKVISSFVSEVVTDINQWEITIIDHGESKADNSKRIVSIVDDKWNGDIYYRTDEGELYTWHQGGVGLVSYDIYRYTPSAYVGIDGNSYDGVLVGEATEVNAISCITKTGKSKKSYTATIETGINQWCVSIVDNGIYETDSTQHIVSLFDYEWSGDIYYTLDNSEPTKDSKKYDPVQYKNQDSISYNGILVQEGQTIKAVSFKNSNVDNSLVAVKTIDVTPWDITIVDNGVYKNDKTMRIISIVDSKWNGDIFYTYDGAEPSNSSLRYEASELVGSDSISYQGVLIPEGETVRACSLKTIGEVEKQSSIEELTTSIDTWNIEIIDYGQDFDDGSKHIIGIQDNEKAGKIYYTLNDSVPDSTANEYSPLKYKGNDSKYYEGLLVEEGQTVKAVSYKKVNEIVGTSGVETVYVERYQWNIVIEDHGQAASDESKCIISIIDNENHGDIFYSLGEQDLLSNGEKYTPYECEDINSNKYMGILVPEATKVSAISYYSASDKIKSSVINELITGISDWRIKIINHGPYAGDESMHIVSIIDSVRNGDIYYTTDDSYPASASQRYVASDYLGIDSATYNGILVNDGDILKAVSQQSINGITANSQVCEKTIKLYDIVVFDCYAYDGDETKHIVSITDSEKNGDIYYSIGNSFPSMSDDNKYNPQSYTGKDSKIYNGILVSEGETIYAISYYSVEDIVEQSYVAKKPIVKPEVGKVGQAGGIVFYDKGSYSDGWRYMEAAPDDLPGRYKFGCITDKDAHFVLIGTEKTVGTGKSNTENLVMAMGEKAYGNYPSEGKYEYAARVCYDYEYNFYDDWFLPSTDELELLYLNLCLTRIIEYVDTFPYWSSSEYSATEAYSRRGTYDTGHYLRGIDKYVRPVRQF